MRKKKFPVVNSDVFPWRLDSLESSPNHHLDDDFTIIRFLPLFYCLRSTRFIILNPLSAPTLLAFIAGEHFAWISSRFWWKIMKTSSSESREDCFTRQLLVLSHSHIVGIFAKQFRLVRSFYDDRFLRINFISLSADCVWRGCSRC